MTLFSASASCCRTFKCPLMVLHNKSCQYGVLRQNIIVTRQEKKTICGSGSPSVERKNLNFKTTFDTNTRKNEYERGLLQRKLSSGEAE